MDDLIITIKTRYGYQLAFYKKYFTRVARSADDAGLWIYFNDGRYEYITGITMDEFIDRLNLVTLVGDVE